MRYREQYTKQQLDEFKRQFARRHRAQWILTGIVMVILVAFVFTTGDDRPISLDNPGDVFLLVGLLITAGGAVFSFANWRCPACCRWLGKSLNPKFCPNCGIPYAAEKVPSETLPTSSKISSQDSLPQPDTLMYPGKPNTDREVQELRHVHYTEQQLDEFKQEFAQQRRRQIVVGTAAIAIVIGAGIAGEMEIGIPGGILLLTFIFTILGSLVFVLANWRCPACKNHFGFGGSVNQGYCPKCGVPLREK